MKYLVIIFILIFSLNTYSNVCIDNAFKDFKLNKYESAISQLKSCEAKILDSEDPELLSKYYYGLGRSYLELGIIDSAFKYELKSFNIKKSFELNENLNLSYNDLGIIYNKIGLPHKSIFFLNNAIRINLNNSNNELLYNNYLNIGISYKDLAVLDSTEKYFLMALKINSSVNAIELSKLYNNIAVLYQEQNKYKESITYSKMAIESKGISEIKKLKYSTNLELTKLLNNEKHDKKIFRTYFNNSERLTDKNYLADALFKLSIVNKSNYIISLEYLNKFISLLRSDKNYNGCLIQLKAYKNNINISILNANIFNSINSLEKTLLSLNTRRIAKEYGNELKINQESDIQITNLKTDLKYANLGFYGLLFFFIFIFSIVILTILWIKKNNIVQRLIERIVINNRYNHGLSNGTKSELGKLLFLLDTRLDYNSNKLIFNTIDKVIHNVNNIDSQIFSNNLKEAECQILQHQQITNGSETL